ncbi:MAG TPA: DinB family protein [Chloroflexota bacterium]|nr:DinB family protein [Chloroflexota bacterium]
MAAPSSNMRILTDLYRYNNWANARVFAACAALDAALLREEAPGTHGTIEGTLKHLVGVEAAYLLMLQGLPLDQGDGQEAYFAQELAWFAEHATQVGAGYLQLLADQGDALLDRDLAVPWFDFALTASDGLLQVLSHSAQHRAQVLSALGARDFEVPNIDYVFMVGGEGA